jgi:NAD(P)-dependent dehydrogenase (short-subunit alcohol dehydrogenase family)
LELNVIGKGGSMNSKVCLITGANSGIGFAAAKIFAQNGYAVILGCRNKNRGIDAESKLKNLTNNNSIYFIELDMSLQESIKSAVNKINDIFDHIDVLIHNAADFDLGRKKPFYTTENIESVWATNHIGPVLLTQLLLGLLKKSPQGRIITIASQGLLLYPKLKINHIDPEFRNGHYSVEKAYYQSKLAQVMYTYWLSEDLNNAAITVNCIRVTNVKIDISRYPNITPFMKWLYSIKSQFSITPGMMAETYFFVATNPNLSGISGKYYNEKNEQVKSSAYSYDKGEITKLVETTDKFLKRDT